MRRVLLISLFAAFAVGCDMTNEEDRVFTSTVIESFELNLPATADYQLGYSSEMLEFSYNYDETYGSWSGFAQSRKKDMEDASYNNQYSVYNDEAASGDCFMVYYYDSYNDPTDILCRYHGYYQFKTVRVNLSTISYKAIMEGNAYARAFDEGDYLKVSFIALGADLAEGDAVDYYIVDYRDGKRFVADDWNTVDISSLKGGLWGLRIRIETTDVGEWGANTPLYICLDDLTYTFELV